MKLENVGETILGALVIAVAIGFTVYAAQNAGSTVGGNTYDVSASFSKVGAVGPGTDVRIAGVKIGSVSDVTLDPQSFRATIIMAIRNGVEIPEDTIVAVDADGLLGGSYVSLLPGAALDNVAAGEFLENTQSPKSVNDIIAQALGAIGNANAEQ